MSEAPQVEVAEVEDFFESGGGGYPTISTATEKIGVTFGGYVLPISAAEPNKTHVTTGQTDIEGKPLYWPRKPGETKLRPRPQAEINLQTDYRSREFMSDKAIKRAKENDDQPDDGLRRWIVKGKSATQTLKAELTRLGVNRAAPPPGTFVQVTLVDRKEVPKGTENIYDVKLTAPDAKGRQIVADHLARLAEQADPEGTGAEEEPPF